MIPSEIGKSVEESMSNKGIFIFHLRKFYIGLTDIRTKLPFGYSAPLY